MDKHDNFKLNFSLVGNSSIQVGLYFLITAYLLKSIFEGFLIDDNALGMLSAEIIEFVSIFIVLLTLLLSGFAVYFKAKRNAKKFNYVLWNNKSKKTVLLTVLSFVAVLIILCILMRFGEINFIVPVFLLFYGVFLFITKSKSHKNIVIISLTSILLAALCYFIPSYWYASIFILGIAHITYGIMIRK